MSKYRLTTVDCVCNRCKCVTEQCYFDLIKEITDCAIDKDNLNFPGIFCDNCKEVLMEFGEEYEGYYLLL